jgi:hypothetical protein
MLLVSAFQDSIPKIFRYVITGWETIRDMFLKIIQRLEYIYCDFEERQ